MRIALKSMLLFVLIGFMTACSSGSTGEKVDAQEVTEKAAEATMAAQTFKVNAGASVINWTGKKSFVGDAHTGTMALSNGKLSVEGGKLTAGMFTIDMASLKSTDIEDEKMAGQLVGHLSSPDFFNVPEHPTATFEITSVDAVEGDMKVTHNITGNLTLLGTSKQVTIPANVAIAGGKMTATTPPFTIDRTQWGITYGGEEAAKLENLAKDRIISNDITLQITLNAAS